MASSTYQQAVEAYSLLSDSAQGFNEGHRRKRAEQAASAVRELRPIAIDACADLCNEPPVQRVFQSAEYVPDRYSLYCVSSR